MANALVHKLDLCSPEEFRTILEHEVSRSHRYGDSLTLVHMMVEADPAKPEHQRDAYVSAVNALSLYLRHADVSCKKDTEFQILLPATGAPGARTACERVKKLMLVKHEQNRTPSFKLLAYFGVATLPNEDQSVTSAILAEHAEQALAHARSNQLTGVVSFSELNN